MEKNILITIEYDGTNYSGWQRQSKVKTVQGRLEDILSKVCGHDVNIDGTSRTDAGVHAHGQRATFLCRSSIPTERILLAANNMLNGGINRRNCCADIRVIEAQEVAFDFHARYDSIGKTYKYLINFGEPPDIFMRNYCYSLREELDVDNMIEAKKYIEGKHDFKCFQASGGTPKETTVRNIKKIEILNTCHKIEIRVTGDGFLYNMVRIIVGTLVEVGLGKIQPAKLKEIIESKDRRLAGHTAPAQGLYLEKVYYNDIRREGENHG